MGASLDYLARLRVRGPLVRWFVCGGGGASVMPPGYNTTITHFAISIKAYSSFSVPYASY